MGTVESTEVEKPGSEDGGAVDKSTIENDAELERLKIIQRLGLDATDNKSEVVWLKESLGFQSKCFLLRGERWKDQGKQAVIGVDNSGSGSAFVKCLPSFTVQEAIERKQSEARLTAEMKARAAGASEDEALIRGKEAREAVASKEVTAFKWEEPSEQLLRERQVLRAWQAAEDAGELQLPEDTILVVPRLVDNIVVDKHSQEEEVQPTFLVFEDLVSAGFKAQHYTETLSVDDAVAVSGALADFHAGLWRIRHRIEPIVASRKQETCDSRKEVYESLLRKCLQGLRDFELVELVDLVEPFSKGIVDISADDKIGPIIFGHGDPWVHNVMLRRTKTGTLDGVAFIDLGNIRLMNPLVDFYSFFGTMMDMKTLYQTSTSLPLCKSYKSRLFAQLPDVAKSFKDKDGKDIYLFSTKARLHAFACMLPYFFSFPMWLFGGEYAASRCLFAFRYTAHLVERYQDGHV